MPKKTTIKLWLRSEKKLKNGTAPLYIIYQLSGERKYIATDIKIRPENWDNDLQQAIYIDKKTCKKVLPEVDFDIMPLQSEINKLNTVIVKIINNIRGIEENFLFNQQSYKLDDIINTYKELDNNKPKALKSDPKVYITDYITTYVNENTGLRKVRTLQSYATLAKHLMSFGEANKEKVTFTNLTISMLKKFQKYLLDTEMNNTTIAKQFSILKAILKNANIENRNLKICQDYRDFTISRTDADNEVIALEQHEFDAIINLDLSDYSKSIQIPKIIKGKEMLVRVGYKGLDKVRDLFIFSCTTSLRYSDIADLKRSHIRENTIYKKAIKTGQNLEIPLNAFSHFILEKYKGQINPLPVLSNQKANDYLKALGKLAGIDTPVEKTRTYGSERKSKTYRKYELMSMHLGRRTFATLSLEKGVASQDVMSLTGHKMYASFKRYVNITKAQKQKAMDAWGKIEKAEAKSI